MKQFSVNEKSQKLAKNILKRLKSKQEKEVPASEKHIELRVNQLDETFSNIETSNKNAMDLSADQAEP